MTNRYTRLSPVLYMTIIINVFIVLFYLLNIIIHHMIKNVNIFEQYYVLFLFNDNADGEKCINNINNQDENQDCTAKSTRPESRFITLLQYLTDESLCDDIIIIFPFPIFCMASFMNCSLYGSTALVASSNM